MEILKFTFDILEHGATIPVGFNKVSSHFVFNDRMTLGREAILVEDRHRKLEPEWFTFSGVVSRESV